MSRLTLRLPESLHHRLAEQANQEGVSLNQYVVCSLSRMATVADIESQRETFRGLTTQYTDEEAQGALRELLSSRASPRPRKRPQR